MTFVQHLDMTDIIVALIGALTTIIAALLGRLKSLGTEKRLLKKVNNKQDVVTFADVLSRSLDLFRQVSRIQKETEFDRFILFVANISDKGNPTTDAFVEIRNGTQAIRVYQDVPLDLDYIKKLNRIKTGESLSVVTQEERDCLIKAIYQDEEVTESIWSCIYYNKTHVCYCSHATHSPGGITKKAAARNALLINRFRNLAKKFVG